MKPAHAVEHAVWRRARSASASHIPHASRHIHTHTAAAPGRGEAAGSKRAHCTGTVPALCHAKLVPTFCVLTAHYKA